MKTLGMAWILGWVVLTLGLGVGRGMNPWFADLPALAVLPLLGLLVPGRAWRGLAFACTLAWLSMAAPFAGPLKLRTLVYGVDGATFDVIDEEALPAFAALRADGARGELLSMEPMFSPLLWTTMASGRPPDEHGIRGFHVQSKDCRVARWWDVAEDRGDAVGLYKWLVDYPPRTFAHGGFWVPSWLAPAPEAWPERLSVVKEVELGNRLRRKQVASDRSQLAQAADLVRVGVRFSTLARIGMWTVEQRLLHPDAVRTNVAMQLLRGWIDRDVFVAQLHAEDPDVASFTYYATDGLGHLYWDRHAAGGDEVRIAYRQADAILASLLAELPETARLVIVSDHGFKAMDGTGLAGQFAPKTERLRARLSEIAPVDVSKLGHKLVVGTDGAHKAEILAAIEALKDRNGEPFYRASDIPEMADAIGLTLGDETITAERMAADTVGGEPIAEYVALTDAYTGTHEEHGVIYLYGPGVPPGTDLGEVPMLDVAPTILAAAGLPADRRMRGKAQLFPELERVESWDGLVPGLSWLDGESGVNDARLKELGYTE